MDLTTHMIHCVALLQSTGAHASPAAEDVLPYHVSLCLFLPTVVGS